MARQRPHRCDIWEPTEHIEGDGEILAPTYTKTREDEPATFQPVDTQKRAMSALDLTHHVREVFLDVSVRFSALDAETILARTDEEGAVTFWRALEPPRKWSRHWEFLVVEDTSKAEVTSGYGG